MIQDLTQILQNDMGQGNRGLIATVVLGLK